MKIKQLEPITPEKLAEYEKQAAEIEKEKKRESNKKLIQGNLRPGGSSLRDEKNRFHLPVLHINDPTQWPSQPLESRLHWTDKVAYNTCLGNCCGVEGLKAGCCHMDPYDMEHVLGPLDEEWIKKIVAWLRKRGIMATRADVVIDYEEGKIIGENFFNGERKAVFLSEDSYPILRFQVAGPRFACKFLNIDNGKCTIYEERPDMCRGYLCQYVRSHFLVKTPTKPNTYTKLR